MPESCYWSDYEDASNFNRNSTKIIASVITNTNNDMYGKTVSTVGLYFACPTELTDGSFKLGVWDSNGDNRSLSTSFTCADMAVGSAWQDTEKLCRSVSPTVTLNDGDCVGVIPVTPPTGSSDSYELKVATDDQQHDYWARSVFPQGSDPQTPAYLDDQKAVALCLNCEATPEPSSSTARLPPPPIILGGL
jgi:hypothetical protein